MKSYLPFDGWRVRYWTSNPTPGLPSACASALRAAMPGASVSVEVDPDADAIAIIPPQKATTEAMERARGLASLVVERTHRAGVA